MTDARSQPDQRRRLLGVKLTALVSAHRGEPVHDPADEFGYGAALIVDDEAWVLIDGDARRTLGAALSWAIRRRCRSVDVIAETGGGRLARRATGFQLPIRVGYPEGRALLPVVAEAAPAPTPAAHDHLVLRELIEAGGARPHVERGVVTGEVRGLEVCRVVDEATVGAFAEANEIPPELVPTRGDGVTLEVGVGAHDREAFRIIHGHLPTVDALSQVVARVAEHRRVDAPQHPLNRMAPERFLRWQAEQDPAALGLGELWPVDPPVDRPSMKRTEPCVAHGVDDTGRPVAIVFSSGVDLDLMPFVADAALDLPDGIDRLLAVVPARDLVPITRDLASLLVRPVELVGR